MPNEVSVRQAAHFFGVLKGSFSDTLSKISNDNGAKLKLNFRRLDKIFFSDKRARHISVMSKHKQLSIDLTKI
jgi:hypothetical protein